MKEIIKIILTVINRSSLVFTLLLLPFSYLAEILNPPIFEKILMKLNIHWSFEHFLFICYICVALLIITYIILKKFFTE